MDTELKLSPAAMRQLERSLWVHARFGALAGLSIGAVGLAVARVTEAGPWPWQLWLIPVAAAVSGAAGTTGFVLWVRYRKRSGLVGWLGRILGYAIPAALAAWIFLDDLRRLLRIVGRAL